MDKHWRWKTATTIVLLGERFYHANLVDCIFRTQKRAYLIQWKFTICITKEYVEGVFTPIHRLNHYEIHLQRIIILCQSWAQFRPQNFILANSHFHFGPSFLASTFHFTNQMEFSNKIQINVSWELRPLANWSMYWVCGCTSWAMMRETLFSESDSLDFHSSYVSFDVILTFSHTHTHIDAV